MKVYSATLFGVTPLLVEIEIDLSSGLPFFQIVGLPDAVLRESKTRVKSAIIQAGFDFPYDSRLVLNLSPSKVRKEGSAFELALAARILSSSNQVSSFEGSVLFLGELALDGSVRAVDNSEALSFSTEQALGDKIQMIVAPMSNVAQVRKATDCQVVGINHLRELSRQWWSPYSTALLPSHEAGLEDDESGKREAILAGLEKMRISRFWAKHLSIAACGRHSYLLCGPPGAGKTFFADSLKMILSALGFYETPVKRKNALDSIFERAPGEIPWAAPHHSVTTAGLLGGGVNPQPGALTRAHGGILFLDELLEFSPHVLDALREPQERKEVEIFRTGSTVKFPADFQLIAATNPCRCGFWQHPWIACKCHAGQKDAYQAKISGPLFDRFDVKIFTPPSLTDEETVSGFHVVEQVRKATPAARVRLSESEFFAKDFARRFSSRRSLENVKKVSLTLARLEQAEEVDSFHIREAISYQKLKCFEKNRR